MTRARGPGCLDDLAETAIFRVVVPTPDSQAKLGVAHALRRHVDTPAFATVPRELRASHASLVTLCGPQPGRAFLLDRVETTLGRDPSVTIPLEDPGLSRRHASIVREGNEFEIRDTGSKNGTFVRMRPVERATLRNGDPIQLGPNIVLRFSLTDAMEHAMQERLFRSSTYDELTGALNRSSFFERLRGALRRARVGGGDVSLLMIDVDHFKSVNDRHGHAVGDAVLKSLSTYLIQAIRAEDVLGRYGGEEFLVLATGTSNEDATALAERLRSGVMRLPTAVPVTISIGVASLVELGRWEEANAHDDANAVVDLADRRVYVAKAQGRNRVVTL